MTKFTEQPREVQIKQYVELCKTLEGMPADFSHLTELGIDAERIAEVEKTTDDLLQEMKDGLCPEDLKEGKRQFNEWSLIEHYVGLRLSVVGLTPEKIEMTEASFNDFLKFVDDLLLTLKKEMGEELAAKADKQYEDRETGARKDRETVWRQKLDKLGPNDRLGYVQEFAHNLRVNLVEPPTFLAAEVAAENSKGKGNWSSVKIARLNALGEIPAGVNGARTRKALDKAIDVLANDGDRDAVFKELLAMIVGSRADKL